MYISQSATDTEVAEQGSYISTKYVLSSIGSKAAWIFKHTQVFS